MEINLDYYQTALFHLFAVCFPVYEHGGVVILITFSASLSFHPTLQ